MARAWIADDLPDIDYEPCSIGEGRYWSSGGGDEFHDPVRRPIGFMRNKPRIRVKAWTMPILPKDT